MKNKTFIFVVCALSFALSVSAEAQQAGKVYRIGYLAPRTVSDRIKAFQEGLREHGYIDGQNVVVEYRFAGGQPGRFSELAAELVRINPDVIFAYSTGAVRALKKATTTLPLVTVSGNPVRAGFVTSLARPGGNITGLANLTPELAGKRLELLKEIIPNISRVAVLWNPDNPIAELRMGETEAAAKALDIELQPITVKQQADLERVYSTWNERQVGAILPLRDVRIQKLLEEIVEFAQEVRVPGMYDYRAFVKAGGLISYGTYIADLDRRAAAYVDKILKGAKPGDLPIERPRKFELFINLTRARELGITIPPEVLYRADKVIK